MIGQPFYITYYEKNTTNTCFIFIFLNSCDIVRLLTSGDIIKLLYI